MKAHQVCTGLGFVLILMGSLTPAMAQGDARRDAAPSPQDAIAAALETKVSLEFQKTSLQQIANDIGKSQRINVVIDAKSLGDAGVAPDTALSVHVADVTLHSALDVLLHQADLTFVIRNEVLLITTTDRASTELTTKSYNVADLVTHDEDGEDEDCEGEDDENEDCVRDVLEDLLVTTIAPSTWGKVGGPGSISAFGDCRVISQTGEVHRQIDNLLAALRKLKNAPDRTSDKPIWAIDPAELQAEEKIEAALAKKTDIVVEGMPLADFAGMLENQERLPVQLDAKALGDAGLARDTAVTLNVHEITLRSALALMLEQFDMITESRDEVLWITTTDAASTRLQVAVYPVVDLIGKTDEQNTGSTEMLIHTIMTTVAPSTWSKVGGPGNITAFAPLSCLVVQQTQATHSKLRHFVADLREARGESHQSTPGKTAER
jgi:hypothetical protein